MKRTISIILAVLMTASFAACFSGCGNSSSAGEVNVYNWGEYISNGEDDLMDVIDEFESETGIKVNYTTYETNEELYNMLKNSNVSYDVIIPSDYMISKLIEEDMLLELDFNNIPNYENIPDYALKVTELENQITSLSGIVTLLTGNLIQGTTELAKV